MDLNCVSAYRSNQVKRSQVHNMCFQNFMDVNWTKYDLI